MAFIWKEFPEINRSLGFSSNYNASPGGLGCHCGMITGVKLTWGEGYYSGGDGKNIKVIDTTKEPQVVWTKDRYNDYYVPPTNERQLVLKFLKEQTNLRDPDFLKEVYTEVIKKCQGIPLWVISDAINYESDARNPNNGSQSAERFINVMVGSSGGFVKYLIENKIGYILQSPIVQNPMHRSMGSYSLNQGWFWIPPDHLARAVDTAEAFGEDKFVSREAWEQAVARDLKLKDPLEACKYAFDNGVFPEEKRFHRKKMSAKAVEELQTALDENNEPEVVLDKNYNTTNKRKVKEA